jgi:eukaryotic-like serine/threonine-protein kinase
MNSFFDNLAFQGQATIIKGDSSGLIFRALKSGSYLFEVSYSGTYDLLAYKGASTPTVLVSGTSTVINTGLDQSNLLTVVAYGNHLYLYINKQPVASVTDSTNTTGQIALSGGTTTGSADVAFNNVQVWSI